MKYLTERQRDILNFIREFQKERGGVAPTHREICDHFGFSSYGTVYKHLSLLEKKGLIRRDWNQKRGVELVEQPEAPEPGVRELPLFGYIAAGRPLDAETEELRLGQAVDGEHAFELFELERADPLPGLEGADGLLSHTGEPGNVFLAQPAEPADFTKFQYEIHGFLTISLSKAPHETDDDSLHRHVARGRIDRRHR